MIKHKILTVIFLQEFHLRMQLVRIKTKTLELLFKQDLETQQHKINTLV
jgi:hypothetical protein